MPKKTIRQLEKETDFDTPQVQEPVPEDFVGIELPDDWRKHKHGNFEELGKSVESLLKKIGSEKLGKIAAEHEKRTKNRGLSDLRGYDEFWQTDMTTANKRKYARKADLL